MVKNRYVKEINVDKTICLYNPLNQELIYLIDDEAKTVWNNIDNLNNLNGREKELIEELINRSFIVDESNDYGKQIESIITTEKRTDNINIVYFVPALKCNMICKYCHIKNKHDANTFMNKDVVDQAFELVMKYNNPDLQTEIVFYGGEPTLNFDILSYVVERGKALIRRPKFTLFTNGTFINENMARFFAENDIFVIVSIDGNQEDNDRGRIYPNGSGTYADIVKGCNILKKNKCSVAISLVMGQHNFDNLTKNVEHIIQEINPINIGLSTLHMISDGKNPMDVDITKLTEKMIDIFNLTREYNIYSEHLFRRIRPIVEKKIRIADCPSCGSKLVIVPNGTVTFCEAYMQEDEYTYKINEFDKKENQDYLRWANRTPLKVDTCQDCIALTLCGGGCPYDAEKRDGNLNKMDSVRCTQSKIIAEWCIKEIFNINKEFCKRRYFIPSIQNRKKLYGNINFQNLPLRTYSQQKEKNIKQFNDISS